jgi:mannose-1-phosphate guanylyltransferase/mannose-6-phosphate isomerase
MTVSTPLVVCNEKHRFLVAEQLSQMGLHHSSILLEPIGRNTAPALTIAALCVASEGGDPILAVLPSDHYVEDVAGFQDRLLEAVALAREGYIVTFGIVPDKPETGFGYIHRGVPMRGDACVVRGFREKPDLEAASEYIASGEYLWNSGIFILQASTWIEAIGHHAPEILEVCQAAFANHQRDGDFVRVDSQLFSKCPSDSIDYAVMEHLTAETVEAARAAVIPLDVGWSDLGSWPALTAIQAQDERGNVSVGDVFAKDTYNSLLYSQHRFVAAVGLQDVVIIETKDAVLVAHKDRAQDVKSITDYLKRTGRSEHLHHRKVHRPWGDYESVDEGSRYQVKRLTVRPGASLSLQMHHHRAEHWIVVRGTARVYRGEDSFLLTENESTYIPIGVTHRLENPGSIPLEIIEVQSGSYLGEDDIVRFEDRYNRL